MPKFDPKVTIIIPVYNGEEFLEQAITSALEQTYENKEIIVINDGSKDKSEAIAKKYTDKIKYIYKKNGGVASALNEGIKAATGEYISWLSHDDLYYPEKVEAQIKLLEQEQNKELIVACNVELVDKNLNLIEKHQLSDKFEKYPLSYLTFNVTTGLNGCALLIPKKLFEKNGYFDLNLRTTQDYDMWSRFAINEKFIILNKILVKSRQHDNQGSRTIKCVQQEVDELHSRFISQITDQEFQNYFDNNLEEMFNTIMLYKDAMQSYNTAVAMYKKVYDLYISSKSQEVLAFFNKNFLYEKESNFSITKPMKKRILFYNNIWVRGGIERVLTTQFKALKKDYELFFVSSKIDHENGFTLPKEVHIIKLSDNIDTNLPVAIFSLCKLLNIDLFIGNQNLDVNVLNTYKLLNKNNIMSIASNHYSYYLPAELNFLEQTLNIRDECYKNATAVVWTNSISAKLHSLKISNSYYIPNPNSFPISEKVTPNNKNIICVGRFDDQLKHIEWTLEAFSKALKYDKDLKLIVVGKFDQNGKVLNAKKQKFKTVLNDLKIPKENIEFVGQTENVEKYYKEASLLILTSQSEGFGMVITEAATFGVPTIAFNILGLKDLITSEQDGYLIDCYNVEQMATKIVEYFSDEAKMSEMKYNALKKAKKYEEKEIMQEWKVLIKNVLDKEFTTNIEQEILPEDLVKIFDKTLNNINRNIKIIQCEYQNKRGIFTKITSKVVHQYQTYGLKKTIKEICYYPVKIIKKIIKKITKK